MISGYSIAEDGISAEGEEAWPLPAPFDLSTAVINTDSVYTSNLFHFFALATATSSGAKDIVTGEIATTTGTISTAGSAAGDGFVALNPYGFTPAVSVDDLTDQLTIVVVAKAQVLSYAGFFGHLFSQHPAWFLTNQDYTSAMPRRFAVEAGGVEYSVNFADAGESADPDSVHVYVGTYDGAYVRTYQDGYLVQEIAASGNLTGQDAAHTRIGSYWGATGSANLGATVEVICFGAAEAWTDAKVLGYMSDPWRNSLRAPGGAVPEYDVVPDAGSQSQVGNAPAVAVEFDVAPAKGAQSQVGNTPSIGVAFGVLPAKGSQTQTGNAPVVGVAYNIVAAKGTQSQIGNSPVVSARFDVVPNKGSQLQYGNSVTVDITYDVAPAKGTQSQTGNSPSIGPISAVEPAKGSQAQSSNAPAIGVLYQIAPAKGTQLQFGNSPIVSSQDQVVPSVGRQTQTGNVVSIHLSYHVVPEKGTQLQRGAASAALINYHVAPVKAYQAQRGAAVQIGFDPTVLPAHGAQAQYGSYEWPRDVIELVVSADTSFVSMIDADTSFLIVIDEQTSIL